MPEQQPPRPRPPASEARGITTSCPACGVLHLASTAFVLVVCPTDAERSFYQFTCPRCDGLVTRHASERTVLGMTRCGVTMTTLPSEALEDRSGPALTVDDLLDLVLHLDSETEVAAFLAASAPSGTATGSASGTAAVPLADD